MDACILSIELDESSINQSIRRSHHRCRRANRKRREEDEQNINRQCRPSVKILSQLVRMCKRKSQICSSSSSRISMHDLTIYSCRRITSHSSYLHPSTVSSDLLTVPPLSYWVPNRSSAANCLHSCQHSRSFRDCSRRLKLRA